MIPIPKGGTGMHLYERPRGQNRGLVFAVALFVLIVAFFPDLSLWLPRALKG